ncbi:sulfite oxidase heme-binding subunit YedZ [Pararhodobacter sp.]|uniref:sulfite oxidase heme-binding subunit YedZ n=1 Tax=Pararhodobacter sp. TaxID=2127056 RepID=UPI002AFEC713|nr:ferric reductase-like transmembrane domain-containing protein [Pararhodobacter sp.]
MLSRFSPYWLWALFALPAALMSYQALTSTDPRIFHQLVHPSGEFSARFLIVTMMATPLAMLFKGWGFTRWLRKNRRYLGVTAFGYAALHTVFYVIDKASVATIMAEVPRFYIWTGWIAFLIFVPLAVTSTDYFMRVLGPRWKTVQRSTYVAAVLTLLHWASLHDWGSPTAALVHFGPLAALEAYRVWYWYLRPRPLRA